MKWLYDNKNDIKKGQCALLIWSADMLKLGNDEYNIEHFPVLVPVQVIQVDEPNSTIVVRPRIFVGGKWKVFKLGKEPNGDDILTIEAQQGDGVFERIIPYDWFSNSEGIWTNEIFEPSNTLKDELKERSEA